MLGQVASKRQLREWHPEFKLLSQDVGKVPSCPNPLKGDEDVVVDNEMDEAADDVPPEV